VGRKGNSNGSFINSTLYPSFNHFITLNPSLGYRSPYPHFNSKERKA
jgi:hypothetical protein